MSELAERMRITRSRLTHAVTRLEQAGYAQRRNHPADRRSQLVALTDRGAELLAQAAPGHVEAIRRAVFDALTPDQVQQLAEISEAITRALQRTDPAAYPAALPWHRR